jgi:starch phosphorylase
MSSDALLASDPVSQLSLAIEKSLGKKDSLKAAAEDITSQQPSIQELISRATTQDLYFALAPLALKRLLAAKEETQERFAGRKHAFYLSMEWLMGPQMDTALVASGLFELIQKLLGDERLQQLLSFARDLGIGNGGLGRLAACYIEAAAQQDLPEKGYGLWFKKGFLYQKIGAHGQQIEEDDPWLETGGIWAITQSHPVDAQNKPIMVRFGGRIEVEHQPPSPEHPYGFEVHKWVDTLDVPTMLQNLLVPSDAGKTVLPLGLWAVTPGFDSQHYLAGPVNRINDRLYPDESTREGKKQRLVQEFFLSSASVQATITYHEKIFGIGHLENLDETAAMQLNDTHPALAIPELIRILHDERGMGWKKATQVVRKVCFYTNHTLAPEALEKWDRNLFAEILPRHMEIIEGLNNDLMQEFDAKANADTSGDLWTLRDGVKLIDNEGVHMARMSAAFTKMTNGVSKLHSELVKKTLFPGLAAMGRTFWNVTNGISPRRWLQLANPRLSHLLTETVGDEWKNDLGTLVEKLEPFQEDNVFLTKLNAVKKKNKKALAALILQENGVVIDTDALIACHTKRLHEYKRQALTLFVTVAQYLDILAHPDKERPKLVNLFAGKAAPSYKYAKDCITLINWLGNKINNDPIIGDKLKTVFVSDNSVSRTQTFVSASDISEQTSMAGMEASGTGNMKYSLNGSLTVGTEDGANIEIGAYAGSDHFFFFGLNEREVEVIKTLSPEEYKRRYVEGDDNARLRGALEYLSQNLACDSDPEISRLAYMANNILAGKDKWLVAADFNDCWDKHEQAHALYLKPLAWAKEALINIRAGAKFSAIGSVMQYYEQWTKASHDAALEPEPAPQPPADYVQSPVVESQQLSLA